MSSRRLGHPSVKKIQKQEEDDDDDGVSMCSGIIRALLTNNATWLEGGFVQLCSFLAGQTHCI